MVKEYGAEETTDKIRSLKHSKKIHQDVALMLELKEKYKRLKKEQRRTIIQNQCMFLWQNYTNIFNKLFEDYLDLEILYKFIKLLSEIEEGKTDQHEASAKVGQILKEIYIDSALRENKSKESKRKKKVEKPKKTGKNISWSQYKKSHLN
tara:strand:- start:558 stop:1007 length:450 start_codon:yes stop_codon:yes gene_type:complete